MTEAEKDAEHRAFVERLARVSRRRSDVLKRIARKHGYPVQRVVEGVGRAANRWSVSFEESLDIHRVYSAVSAPGKLSLW